MKTLYLLLSIAMTLSVTAAAAGTNDTGVRGTVAWAGSCPGPAIEGTNDCRVPNANRLVTLTDRSGHVIATSHTSERGEFRLPAKPGQYRVSAPSAGKIGACRSVPIVVPRDAFAEVVIECDSGVR